MKKMGILLLLLVFLASCSSKSVVQTESYQPHVMEDKTMGFANSVMEENYGNDRKQIVTASIHYKTEKFNEMIEQIGKIVKDAPGYVQSSNQEYYNVNNLYGEFVLRIPSKQFESVIEQLNAQATLVSRRDYINDITQSYTDTTLRIEMLEVEYHRLLELMAKSEDIQTTLLIEQRLSELMYQLESYKSEIKNYDLQLEYSTLTISVEETSPLVKTSNSMWGEIQETFSKSISTLMQTFQWIVVTLIGNVLYLVLLALGCTSIYYLIKKRKIKE